MASRHGATHPARHRQKLSDRFRFPFPRSPNSSGSSACWTKRLPASPPPKPTPKRTSKTPAPSSKATSNPSSPSAARGGWINNWLHLDEISMGQSDAEKTDRTPAIPFLRYRTSVRATEVSIGQCDVQMLNSSYRGFEQKDPSCVSRGPCIVSNWLSSGDICRLSSSILSASNSVILVIVSTKLDT